jgi:hypothetical protein
MSQTMPSDTGKLDRGIEFGGECRNAVERDAGAAIGDVHGDRAARAFEDEVGGAVTQRHTAGGDRPAAECDRGVAAHRAETGVMHEQHAERCGWGGRHHQRAIHLGMSARLQHQAPAMQIEAGRGIVAHFQNRGAARLGKAVEDEAHRLAPGMHLNGAVGGEGRDGHAGWCGGWRVR